MKVQSMKIKDVKPYENNPRDNEDAVEPTANSIKELGWQGSPIVLDRHNVIVCGHTRYKAAKKLGMQEVPTVYAKHPDGTWLTDDEIKALRLADNKTGELADWDFAKLNDELSDIVDLDMTDFGFDDEDLDLATSWDDSGSLDDYEEPSRSGGGVEFKCPKCGYTGPEKEFKQ